MRSIRSRSSPNRIAVESACVSCDMAPSESKTFVETPMSNASMGDRLCSARKEGDSQDLEEEFMTRRIYGLVFLVMLAMPAVAGAGQPTIGISGYGGLNIPIVQDD